MRKFICVAENQSKYCEYFVMYGPQDIEKGRKIFRESNLPMFLTSGWMILYKSCASCKWS